MVVDLGDSDQNLWRRFFQVARAWDLNYAEFRLSQSGAPDLDRLQSAILSSREWRPKFEFVAFSDALRDNRDLEQVWIAVVETHVSCIVQWADDASDLLIELSVWPPDVLRVDEDEFAKLIVKRRVPPMPTAFSTVLQLARALQDACEFRRVELAMEGDAWVATARVASE